MYDISRLKVNNLTLILLTWRKWCAPNNASKYQVGFNSGFKGLNLVKTPTGGSRAVTCAERTRACLKGTTHRV